MQVVLCCAVQVWRRSDWLLPIGGVCAYQVEELRVGEFHQEGYDTPDDQLICTRHMSATFFYIALFLTKPLAGDRGGISTNCVSLSNCIVL